jgi:hypothetical protein
MRGATTTASWLSAEVAQAHGRHVVGLRVLADEAAHGGE